jgi:imidazole glycerol-phosphate synthase subunit HisH
MITIIDYGIGNLGSILNMFRYIGANAEIARDVQTIARANKILLPGVGAFDPAMSCLNSSGFRDTLDQKVMRDGVPVLGICLGMQMLTQSSEEGKVAGLGWIAAHAHRIPNRPGLRIPHMGWNTVQPKRENPLTTGLNEQSRFYFANTYAVQVQDPFDRIMTTRHGIEFDSVISHENIYGAQFHPEKSHKFGMQLLKNFVNL